MQRASGSGSVQTPKRVKAVHSGDVALPESQGERADAEHMVMTLTEVGSTRTSEDSQFETDAYVDVQPSCKPNFLGEIEVCSFSMFMYFFIFLLSHQTSR
jgi:hypothetical protein